MGRTACTEPQCLYKVTFIYFIPLPFVHLSIRYFYDDQVKEVIYKVGLVA